MDEARRLETHPRPASDGSEENSRDTLQALPARDWVRLWANVPAKHLPDGVARELQFSITSFSLDVTTFITFEGLVATSIIVIGLVPLSTGLGQLWLALQVFEYSFLLACLWWLRRSRRRGTLTSGQFNRTLIVPTIAGGVFWGGLPAVVGRDSIELFYLALMISALACSVGYFWTLGHWPLSMIFALVILSCLMTLSAIMTDRGQTMILALGPILFVSLFGISVMAQGVLVRSRYYEVTARDREQTIGLILQDFDRSGQDFLWETDSMLRLTHVPSQMLNASRDDPRVAVGKPLTGLLSDDPDVVAAIAARQPFKIQVVTNGATGRGEVRLWGRPKMVRGELVGYHGVGSDEDAVRRAAESERTSERLDAMVALTSGLAHDFNNQLATILGAVELAALDTEMSDDTLSYLKRAIDACLRTRRITADLVVASGHDATYQPAAFEVASAVTEVADDLIALFPDVRFELCNEDEVWVTADRDHYMRAIHNLIQNAYQAVYDMPADRRRVTVRVHQTDSRDGTWFACTEVRDEGEGVPPELSKRIFEPFSTTRRERGGTGLGLSIARGFAHQAGGRLTLEPSGVGALFRLLVPASRPPTSPPQPATAERSARVDAAPRLKGRYLVIEDDHRVADNVASLVRSFGGNAEVAGSVAEAIERFAGHTGDVECVISDLVLPDGEGYQVIAALRQQHPDLPAIYMSGFTTTLPADVAPELQCPFIPKPFSAAELAEALERTAANGPS